MKKGEGTPEEKESTWEKRINKKERGRHIREKGLARGTSRDKKDWGRPTEEAKKGKMPGKVGERPACLKRRSALTRQKESRAFEVSSP